MHLRTLALAAHALLALALLARPALADDDTASPAPDAAAAPGPSLELNVLWPFYPGGISELRLMLPLFGDHDLRGELLLGTYADYSWVIRRGEAKAAGNVALIAIKTGYRQYLGWGLHAEVCINSGWRHEVDRPGDAKRIDDFIGRAWALAGWELELSPRFYVNARGGAGFLLWRTSHYDEEKKIAAGFDLNLGVRL